MSELMAEILMPTYNGARFVREQIDSLLSQTDGRWHLTVSDDGSTDGTPDILDEYASRYPEKVRRIVSGQRFGNARDHFYWLMRQCDADYLMTCDQDDVWQPDKVRLTLEALLAAEKECGRETPVLVFTDSAPVDERLNPISPSLMAMQRQNPKLTDYRNLLFQNIVTGGTMGLNRALKALATDCGELDRTIMHDWWVALVAARFGKRIYVDQATTLYRQHGDNSVGAQDVRSLRYMIRKVTHLAAFQKTVVDKKRQAEVFAKTFPERLSEEEKRVLRDFCAPRSPLMAKCRYLKWIYTMPRKLGFMARW